MDRRDFLQILNGALGAALLARPLALAAARGQPQNAMLGTGETAALEAVCARILPPVNGISTRDAGCVNFIDKALAHEDRELLPRYRSGIAALDDCARARAQQVFADLAPELQHELLEQLEDGVLAGWNAPQIEQSELFRNWRFHTLLGFLAAPAFGGNRAERGWQAIGFPGNLHRHGAVSDEQVAGTG